MTRRGWLQLVLALLTLLIVLNKAAVELELYIAEPHFEPTALGIAAILVFAETTWGLVAGVQGRQWHLKKKRARKAVLACLITVATSVGLDVTEIGGSVFLVKRRQWYSSEKRLRRVIRHRLRDFPQQSTVEWTKGKGAIGTAWQERRAVHVNLRALSEKYAGVTIDQAQFGKLSAEARGTFQHSEFQSVVGKYAEVLATPIWRKNEIVGVLAIDVPVHTEHAAAGSSLDSRVAKEVAAHCADTLAEVF